MTLRPLGAPTAANPTAHYWHKRHQLAVRTVAKLRAELAALQSEREAAAAEIAALTEQRDAAYRDVEAARAERDFAWKVSNRLTEQRDRARAALQPFADAATDLDDKTKDVSEIWELPVAMSIIAGDLRRAREVFAALDTPSSPSLPESPIDG